MIEAYLQDLEDRIEPEVEETLLAQWRVFADGECVEEVFSPRRPRPALPAVEWPHVLINDALEDFEAMALQQLELCSQALAEGTGALLAVRCNYGTGILPSLFGGERFLMDRDIDTLPACRPLAGGAEAVKRLVAQGVPDLNAGQGETVFGMGQYLVKLLADYPRLARYVHLYHPDLQGPMNVCEMLWGSSLYLDLYDQPDLVRDFLSLIAETYIRFMRCWDQAVCSGPVRAYEETPHGVTTNHAVHWSMLHRGRIMVRNDASTNLSPAMYEEIVRPFDQRLLDELGGGAIHFCGRGDHLIAKLSELSGLYALNTTQPDLNDVEKIFAGTVDKEVNLLGFERRIADQATQRGRPLRGRVHCW
jgi:hypothetical protein